MTEQNQNPQGQPSLYEQATTPEPTPASSGWLKRLLKWGVGLALLAAILVGGGYAYQNREELQKKYDDWQKARAETAAKEGEGKTKPPAKTDKKKDAGSTAALSSAAKSASTGAHSMEGSEGKPAATASKATPKVADVRGNVRKLKPEEILKVSHFGKGKTEKEVQALLQNVLDLKTVHLMDQYQKGVFEDPTKVIWFDYGFLDSKLQKAGLKYSDYGKLRISRVHFKWKPGWRFQIPKGKKYYIEKMWISADDDGVITIFVRGSKRKDAPDIQKRCNGRYWHDRPTNN